MRYSLTARALVKAFHGRTVVDKVSVEVRQGEIVGLLGPNGAGKTTMFGLISGELPVDAGTLFFDTTDVTRWPMYRRARLGIAYLPQEPSVFRGLSVAGNIIVVLEMNGYSKVDINARMGVLLVCSLVCILRAGPRCLIRLKRYGLSDSA